MHGTASSASRDQQTPLLSAITYIPSSKCRRHVTVQQWSMPKPDIGRKSQFLPQIGGPHPCGNIAITFGTENENGMATDSEKKTVKICLFVLTEYTNVTHRQTDTARRHRPRLCAASRGKNDSTWRSYAFQLCGRTHALICTNEISETSK